MSTESLLDAMLQHDRFHNQNTMVTGIAQRAVDHGYDSLSAKQKAVWSSSLWPASNAATH